MVHAVSMNPDPIMGWNGFPNASRGLRRKKQMDDQRKGGVPPLLPVLKKDDFEPSFATLYVPS